MRGVEAWGVEEKEGGGRVGRMLHNESHPAAVRGKDKDCKRRTTSKLLGTPVNDETQNKYGHDKESDNNISFINRKTLMLKVSQKQL